MKQHRTNAKSDEAPTLASSPSNLDTVELLRAQLETIEGIRHVSSDETCPISSRLISTGCGALDALLPAGGFLPGQLVEWLADEGGNGASTLALMVARSTIQSSDDVGSEKVLVVVDRPQSIDARQMSHENASFYPPAAAELGIRLSQLVVLRPRSAADEVWAIDQALRCPSVGVVLAWFSRLNDRDFRRFQLAAEEGGVLGLFIRPTDLRGQPTWANIQFLVETRPSVAMESRSVAPLRSTGVTSQSSTLRRRCWQLTLLRCRGGVAGKQISLELDETTGCLSHAIARTDARSITPAWIGTRSA